MKEPEDSSGFKQASSFTQPVCAANCTNTGTLAASVGRSMSSSVKEPEDSSGFKQASSFTQPVCAANCTNTGTLAASVGRCMSSSVKEPEDSSGIAGERIWKLTYELSDDFSEPVKGHFYSLRCLPREMAVQKVLSCEYEILPRGDISCGTDSFGNLLLTGRCMEAHDLFQVKIKAVVQTVCGMEPESAQAHQLGMYRCMTDYTRMGKNLTEFAQALPHASGNDSWARTGELMEELGKAFRYLGGSTCFHTRAEEAFSQGCGVCQDYAHILLALCRNEGITARYAAGAIPGEGETHAWVEVWRDGFWKGFDPANNREVNEEYIRFAFGRDVQDCSLNRGIFRGGGSQQQKVRVKMEDI